MDNRIDLLMVVPARGGSKGLPDKNIRFLDHKPLLSWTADAISIAGLPNSLALLSTDSERYAEIGRQYGLSVPFLRPADYATDHASSIQVLEHVLDWFHFQYGYFPSFTMLLQPTSPFREPAIIKQAVDMVRQGRADAVIGCKEIFRDLTTLFRCNDGFLRALDSSKPTQSGRQQSQALLTPNGAMYLCNTDYLLTHRSFYPPRTAPLIMNAVQSLDIDSEEDWLIAESFIKQGLV
ncbi:MAG: N-acylneuraminate cytidylyltransferase [Proteobacteria bacterium ST_bin11]|nr:MAG: N-acylneuraminate cytidylyltransferase [Proteobacteria bacterium ST_bin11]